MVATQVTQDGQLLGTLAYMAPEQLAGEADAVSTRTDVYALGIIAFQLLAGRLPHDVSGLGLSTAVTMLSNDDAPRLGTLAEETRGDVETIIGKALEKDPERRYPTASALATDLRRWCEDRPITARPPCRFYRIQKFSRRNRALVAGTAATILTLIIGIIVALTFASRERTQRQVANANERAARINGIKALAALYRSARSDIEAGRTQDAGRSLELVPPHDRDWVWHHLKRRTPNIVGTTSRIDGPHTKLHRAPSHLAPSGNEVYLIDQGRLRIVDLSGRRAVKTPFPDLELSGISDVSGTRIAVYLRDSSRIIDIADLQHSQPQPGHVYFNDDHQFRLFVHFRELVCHRNDQDALVVNVPDGSIFVGGWNIGQAGQRNVALIPMASSTLNSPTQASLIDLDTGTLIATRNEPKGISRGAVALDPRGNAALIGEGDRVIEFESMTLRPTGRAYHAPAGGTFDNTIGYSQDGAFVWAVKTNDDEAGANELFVWQTDTMDLVRRFAHPMLGFGDALSADGKTFLARTKLEEPWIIDFDEQENRSDFVELEGRASWIYHVALSHDEKLIAAMAPAEDIRIWEASTGRLRIRIERPVEKDPSTLYLKHFHRMQQACLAFSKIGDSLLTTEIDGNQIKLIRINVASGVVTREPQRLEDAYRIIADESGTKLLSQQQFVSNDDWCVIGRKDDGWENRFHSLDLLFGEDGTTLCAAPSADDSLAAVGTLDGAFLVDWRAGKLVRRIYSSFGAYIHAVGYSPDFSLLALGTSDGRIVFLETGYYETIYEFQAHPQGRNFAGREDTEPQYNYIRDIRWSNDGTRLITGSGDGTIRMWDAMRIGERRRREISHVAARSFDRSLR